LKMPAIFFLAYMIFSGECVMHVYRLPDIQPPESEGPDTDKPDTHKGYHYISHVHDDQRVVTPLVGVRRADVGPLLLLLLLIAILLAGCGSKTTNSTAATTSSPSASSTPCTSVRSGQIRGQNAVGTLKSLNGSTLQISTLQGTSVTVTYTSTTRFTRQASIVASALQEGESVTVTVSQNADNTYSARRIVVVNTSNGSQAFPFTGQRANSLCARRTPTGGFGNFGGFGNAGNTNGTSGARTLLGTVGQLSGSTLTITDRTGANYTVTVTAQTQISQTTSVTASALKIGMALTVTGTKDNQGGITARTIAILQSLPSRIPTVQTS
jgi:hypothetical protein